MNHVGVATRSIDASVAMYRDTMGATVVHDPFDVPAQGVRVCFTIDLENIDLIIIMSCEGVG